MAKKNKDKERYICCVTGYYDPKDKDKTMIRVTAIVTDLTDDSIKDSLETFCDEDADLFVSKIMNMSEKYNAIIVHSELEPLEKCTCNNCNGFMESFITKKDWQNIKHSKN